MTEQDFDQLLDRLIASTRSPLRRFSAASSWLLLEKRLPKPRHHLPAWYITAAAAATVLLCIMGWWAYEALAPIPMQTFSTLAKTRTVRLPDQTKVVLNRYSTLTCPKRFRGEHRNVQLSGEAYFEVSQDAAHPFNVETEVLHIQVLGTHFNVEAYPQDTQVRTTLLKGSVAVSLPAQNTHRMILSPNESAIYNKETGSLVRQTETEAPNEIQWRDGILLFQNLSLHEITRQLSNAFNTDIQLADDHLNNYHMTATFTHSESLEEILTLLCRNQQFGYTQTSDTIFIAPKLN